MLQRQGRAREALREQLRAIALQPGAVAEGREYARTETRVEGGGGGPVARVKTDGRSNHGESTYYLSAEHESSNAGRPHTSVSRTSAVAISGEQASANRTSAFYASAQTERRALPGEALAGGRP